MRPVKYRFFGSILAIFVVCIAAIPAMSADRLLTAGDGWRMAQSGQLTVIDVRSQREWRATGVARGALPVTIHQRDGALGFVRAMTQAVGGDRSKPIALICARGNRSTRAFAILKQAGFTNVYNIREGMLGRGESKGWIQSGLPIDRCAQC